MRAAMREFDKRHDRVSSRRQRNLSNVVIIVNISLYVVYEAAVRAWGWSFQFGSEGRLLFMTIWIASLLCLVPASGIPAAVSRLLQESTPLPGESGNRENPAVSRARKFFYYPGIYLNIAAVAVLVELSGGLIESQYSAVLFGMVLAGQQLGRFRTNSRILICIGAFLVLALFLHERLSGVRTVPHPPAELEFFILVSSFLIPALFAHIEKRPNYRAKGDFPPPQYVEIYRDEGYDAWRYALYDRHSPLDPAIDLSSGKNVEEARSLIEEKLKSIASLLGLKSSVLEWPDSSDNESLGYIVNKESP
jgi:hypothetical protein